MTTFYLLRHGKRVSRNEDTELSELGIKQAKQVAKYLQKQNISSISASPLFRAQQTAKIIADKLHLPIKTEERLLERMVFDASKEKTFEEFLGEWNKTTADRTYQPLYGDSVNISGERMKSLLDEFDDDKTHLIVTHGGIIGDVLQNLFSDELLPFRSDPTSSLKWVEISECSITELQKKDGKYVLKRASDTSHLS